MSVSALFVWVHKRHHPLSHAKPTRARTHMSFIGVKTQNIIHVILTLRKNTFALKCAAALPFREQDSHTLTLFVHDM